MAEITQTSRGLNPYAPEFFPLHKRLSLSRSTAFPVISYYASSPPNPNQHSYHPFRYPYFHSNIPNPTPTHNYPNNPHPTLTTLQLQVQPSTSEVTKPPTTGLHSHEEEKQQQQQQQQQHGHGGVHTKKAMSQDYLEWSPVHDSGLKTTLMIRNIPNRIKVDELMEFLDDHCAVENGKPEVVTGGVDKSAYDFLYLPIDFETWSSKGYAFVNFTCPKAAWKFYLAAKGRKWDLHRSQKICDIAYAKIQGKENLVSHFKTMGFTTYGEHKMPENVLPVCFEPPRDGSRKSDVQFTTLGIFLKYPSSESSRRLRSP